MLSQVWLYLYKKATDNWQLATGGWRPPYKIYQMKCEYVRYVFLLGNKFTFRFVQLHTSGDLITVIPFTCFHNAIDKSRKEKKKRRKKRFTQQNLTLVQ